jgi:hypothetical protein
MRRARQGRRGQWTLASLMAICMVCIGALAVAADSASAYEEHQFCTGKNLSGAEACGTAEWPIHSAYANGTSAPICLIGPEQVGGGCMHVANEGIWIGATQPYGYWGRVNIVHTVNQPPTKVYGTFWTGSPPPPPDPPLPPPSHKHVSELGFVSFNGSGSTYFDGYTGTPSFTTHSMFGETGYPKITDPQNIDTVALDTDASNIDELGFVRFNQTGATNTHIDIYASQNYSALAGYCETGYPKITDPQNVQTVGIDTDGNGADELGFIRFNGTGNTHIDAYSGSCYKTLSTWSDTAYPKITDPQNVQAVAMDTNGDGTDELGFVRFSQPGSSYTHIDIYAGQGYKNLVCSCDTGYPKITDPQNVRVVAVDTNGDGIDELGFLRYNQASGKAHLDTYTGSHYQTLLASSDTAYPAVSKPENVEALDINYTNSP